MKDSSLDDVLEEIASANQLTNDWEKPFL
jgi:hypothetical protein